MSLLVIFCRSGRVSCLGWHLTLASFFGYLAQLTIIWKFDPGFRISTCGGMTQQFDEDGYGILREITNGPVLKFRNEMTGAEYVAEPSNTLLASEETGESRDMLKHANSLRHTPFDCVNIAIEVPGGCRECGRRTVRMQQLGEQKKAVYVCLCGNRWTNA